MDDEQNAKRVNQLLLAYIEHGQRALDYAQSGQYENLDAALRKREAGFDYVRRLAQPDAEFDPRLLLEAQQLNQRLEELLLQIQVQAENDLQRIRKARKSIQHYRTRRIEYSAIEKQT